MIAVTGTVMTTDLPAAILMRINLQYEKRAPDKQKAKKANLIYN